MRDDDGPGGEICRNYGALIVLALAGLDAAVFHGRVFEQADQLLEAVITRMG